MSIAASVAVSTDRIIPICQELLDKVDGDHELAAILRQLVFSGKALSIRETQQQCFYPKTYRTLQKKLLILSGMRLVDSYRKFIRKDEAGGLVFVNTYKAKNKLQIDDAKWTKFAYVREEDMLMLGDKANYVLAEMINKFHYMASEQDIPDIQLSCTDVINLLSLNMSKESVRLYFKVLHKLGYIEFIYRRQGAKFIIKFTDKLKSYELRKVIRKSVDEVTRAFEAYRKVYFGEAVTSSSRRSWRQTFQNLLEYNGGRDYRDRKKAILGIIAYLSNNKGDSLTVRNPSHIKHRWQYFVEKMAKLSKRSAKEFIKRLVAGKIKSKYYKDPVPDEELGESYESVTEHKAVIDGSVWDEVERCFSQINKTLKLWWSIQSHGVTDIDMEDYLSQAKIFMAQYFSHQSKYMSNRDDLDKDMLTNIKGRLMDYMYTHRCVDKTRGLGERKILKVSVDDFDNFINHINVAGNEYIEPDLPDEMKAALKQLPLKHRNIIKDYFGLNGRKYTYEELGKKHNCVKSNIHRIVQNCLARLRSMLDPPKTVIQTNKN
jgi:hypothetical protein